MYTIKNKFATAKNEVKRIVRTAYVDLDWESIWETMTSDGDFIKALRTCGTVDEVKDEASEGLQFILEEYGAAAFSTRNSYGW